MKKKGQEHFLGQYEAICDSWVLKWVIHVTHTWVIWTWGLSLECWCQCSVVQRQDWGDSCQLGLQLN